jgi:hypothetical protein
MRLLVPSSDHDVCQICVSLRLAVFLICFEDVVDLHVLFCKALLSESEQIDPADLPPKKPKVDTQDDLPPVYLVGHGTIPQLRFEMIRFCLPQSRT